MNRKKRAAVAAETLEISQLGRYQVDDQTLQIKYSVAKAIEGTVHYPTGTLDSLLDERDRILKEREQESAAVFELENCTTLDAAARLVKDESNGHVACLNFASAKNPGGGFLNGSQAQEESLARASALYVCINPHLEHYREGRSSQSSFYTDSMLFSPYVPVFRDDSDELLSAPYEVSFLTSAAVNLRASAKKKPAKVQTAMTRRFEKLCAAAIVNQVDTLVLGAWGCGVFQNDPAMIAEVFYDHLVDNQRISRAFKKVFLAVLDRKKGNAIFGAFEKQFANCLVGRQ